MSIFENLQIALRALAANKLRSALTMLGIIIGVAAVVALIAIGNGATADITERIEGIGTNLITVSPGSFERGGGQNVSVPLTWSDYEALAAGLDDIAAIIPEYTTSVLQITYGDQEIDQFAEASQPAWLHVNNFAVEYGRFFTDGENRARARVVVLGAQTAEDLFDSQNPLGREIRVNDIKFEVIGVLEAKGGTGGPFGGGDSLVVIPIETAYGRLVGSQGVVDGERQVSSISMSAANADVVPAVLAQAEQILRREHNLKPYQDLDFRLISQDAFLDAFAEISATLTIFLGAIAGISLLVGGIGIMNIMLVSVTERTREIGLRKAVGAKKRTILMQFLIETLTLTMIGGTVGVGIGYLIAWSVQRANLINAQVDANSILLAFFFSAAVGVFFGIYPASRAASLRPIEALRYE